MQNKENKSFVMLVSKDAQCMQLQGQGQAHQHACMPESNSQRAAAVPTRL